MRKGTSKQLSYAVGELTGIAHWAAGGGAGGGRRRKRRRNEQEEKGGREGGKEGGEVYIMTFLRAFYFIASKIHIAKIGIAQIYGLGCII